MSAEYSRRVLLGGLGAAAAMAFAPRVAHANEARWVQLPGKARDIASGWVIGTTPAGGGYSIHRWNGSSWTNGSGWDRMPGAGVRIGGWFEDPWVVNDRGDIYRWNESGSNWTQIPGKARDVAENWVIGATPAGGGYSIHRWNGSSWDRMPGAGVRISRPFGSPGYPWVVNDRGNIYRWDEWNSEWVQMPGKARDVGDGWVIGTTPASGGYSIHRWNGSSWDRMPGAAVAISGTSITPLVVNDRGDIYRWHDPDVHGPL